MAVFGQTAPALRLIDFIIAPFVLASIYWLRTRLHSRRVGLWSALLFGVFYFSETFWTLTQNDGIALLPMLLAMVCAFKAADGGLRSWLWAFGAGLLCGWTLWFKYPFALFAVTVAVSYMMLRWNSSPRILWRDVAAAVAGGGLVVLAGIGIMMSLGAWEALIESATVTSQYTALGFNWTDFSAALRTAIGFRWTHWGLLFLLAVVGITLAFRPRWNSNEQSVGAQRVSHRSMGAPLHYFLCVLRVFAVQQIFLRYVRGLCR
jgi:4-amino-4-deoxy-L-arabinose transferase-like glycosyltransferase